MTEPQDNLQSVWFSPAVYPFNNERYSVKTHRLLTTNRNLYKGSDNFKTRVESHAGGTWRNFLECFEVISSVVIGGKSPGALRVWLVIKWLRDFRILGVGGLKIYRLSEAHYSSSPNQQYVPLERRNVPARCSKHLFAFGHKWLFRAIKVYACKRAEIYSPYLQRAGSICLWH